MRDILLSEIRNKFNYLSIYSTFNYFRLLINFVLESKVGIYCWFIFKNKYLMEQFGYFKCVIFKLLF